MTFKVTGHKTLTFIHIPKSGGTSITRWFDVLCTYKPNGYNITKYCPTKDHWGIEEVKQVDNDLGYKFTVVRNPWDYTVSLYAFLTGIAIHWYNKNPNGDPSFWSFDSSWLKHDLPFDTFVRNMHLYPTPLHKNYTFASPQVSWIGDDMDYILRYENLTEDFKVIQDIVGHDNPLGCYNKSVRTDYKDYYNDETKKIVSNIFSEDIEKFKYRF